MIIHQEVFEKPMPKKKEVEGIVPSALATVSDRTVLSDPTLIKRELTRQVEVRKLYDRIIQEYLIKGVDYAPIHINKTCQYKYYPERCTDSSHWSKPSLKKSGSEKIIGLFTLRAEFVKDEETRSMLPDTKDTVFYICKLIHIGSGEVVAEGRGACSTGEKSGNINNTVKIAEKRAKIDAVLSLGFSDSFTQDLEDVVEEGESRETIVTQGKPTIETTVTDVKPEEDLSKRKATFFDSLKHRLDQYPPDERAKKRIDLITQILRIHKEFTREELEANL